VNSTAVCLTHYKINWIDELSASSRLQLILNPKDAKSSALCRGRSSSIPIVYTRSSPPGAGLFAPDLRMSFKLCRIFPSLSLKHILQTFKSHPRTSAPDSLPRNGTHH
jgi:hypothetical protein